MMFRAAAACLTAALVAAGCSAAPVVSGTAPTAPTARAPVVPAGSSLVVTSRRAQLPILDDAGGTEVARLPDHTAAGAPLTLLVLGTRPGWLQVSRPGRPNGRTGWVRQSDVRVAVTPWRLVVSEKAHRMDVLRSGRRVARYPVGVGRAATPTVRGTFFITELLRPPDPDGAYGPYAFGLSAYSEVLTSFAGGPGQLGLHGTNQPGLVGSDVSHGCLRVTNDVITELAGEIPLGTPIEIRP